MGKTVKYQKIILQLLADYAAIKPINWEDAEHQVIADEKNHHYQLVRMGWKDDRYHHYAIFHFDIRDGKVWVRQNRTDADIEAELMDSGIAADDIVVSYRMPLAEVTS
ncbi:MAG: XisI protein [Lewinellaceae bacterium]|nr:XisI protein [Saprospiraceae bacterium]MCB9337801.1 XisI protein [Lewinellaceae bacterium]